MPDPRIVTGFSLLLIGAALCTIAFRVWWTHPVNRVFLFGHYFTEEGLRLLLNNIPLLFVLGIGAIASGAARAAYWLDSPLAPLAGTLEAIVALWGAGSIVFAAGRQWLRK